MAKSSACPVCNKTFEYGYVKGDWVVHTPTKNARVCSQKCRDIYQADQFDTESKLLSKSGKKTSRKEPRNVQDSDELQFENYAEPAQVARKGDAAPVAIQSARIVNGYGTFIQVLGIIAGISIVIVGFVLASSLHSAVFALVGLIVGALDFALFAVQGALFRMISNYVIARLE